MRMKSKTRDNLFIRHRLGFILLVTAHLALLAALANEDDDARPALAADASNVCFDDMARHDLLLFVRCVRQGEVGDGVADEDKPHRRIALPEVLDCRT